MSHYQERLEHDLEGIRERIVEIGDRVEHAVRDAVHALLAGDRDLAAKTVLGDHPINRRVRRLDEACHAFIVRHLPSAGHLRFVSAVMRLSIGLERIGDYAVTIAREASLLSEPPPPTVARDIELLADQVERMLSQSLKAFLGDSAERARGVMGMADQINATFDKVFHDLLDEGRRDSHRLHDLFALLVVFNRLGRIGDQSKNICEEAVFAAAGELKAPKTYQVLFVDETDDLVTQIAVAYARRAFPKSGEYESAGTKAAKELDPRCRSFLESRGYELLGLAPHPLDTTHDSLSGYHVIVSFGGDLRNHVERLPFQTVVLDWDAGGLPQSDDDAAIGQALEMMHDKIVHEIHELMETLRGRGAD